MIIKKPTIDNSLNINYIYEKIVITLIILAVLVFFLLLVLLKEYNNEIIKKEQIKYELSGKINTTYPVQDIKNKEHVEIDNSNINIVYQTDINYNFEEKSIDNLFKYLSTLDDYSQLSELLKMQDIMMNDKVDITNVSNKEIITTYDVEMFTLLAKKVSEQISKIEEKSYISKEEKELIENNKKQLAIWSSLFKNSNNISNYNKMKKEVNKSGNINNDNLKKIENSGKIKLITKEPEFKINYNKEVARINNLKNGNYKENKIEIDKNYEYWLNKN